MSFNDWIVEPNEALDLTYFINAISDDTFYHQHYQDVRVHWLDVFGRNGQQLIRQSRERIPMSALSILWYHFNLRHLEDIIRFLDHHEVEKLQFSDRFKLDSIVSIKTLFSSIDIIRECFDMLRAHGVHTRWRENIRPHIVSVTEQYTDILSKLYPLESIQSLVSQFLGSAPYSSYSIYMCTYIKPITVQLSKNAMATHQGPPGYMPLPNHIVNMCIHESLHGFNGSDEAQEEQKKLCEWSPAFNSKYQELLTKWQSGPEEFFVVGAEAYLSELLGHRTYEQCIQFLNLQNGGMSLSKEIYERLRATRPETNAGWKGYGSWLVHALKNREIAYK
ncbi:hypothetical protein [Paenibacillus terrigena]|uniref:hypothetical protein n=1 Tax=Paenibacillus terrigena TaxID=369333 RepID=UPI0028D133F4|nr:hypothetical protein [Paenibacillus terrigena]